MGSSVTWPDEDFPTLEYSKSTTNTATIPLQKGQLNKVRLYPKICNEHCESSREIQGVISSGNILGQIFRASHDNITQLALTLESAAGVVLDNFEGYADSAALQAAWVASNATFPATLETVIVDTGAKSMRVPSSAVAGDEWMLTAGAQDLTGYSGTFGFYASQIFSKLKMAAFIGDGVNTKSFQIVQNEANQWQEITVDINAMIEDGGGTTDETAITQFGLRLIDRENNNFAYIDEIILTPPPGSIGVKLWNMGATIPVDGVTAIDDGTQYTKIGSNGGVSEFNLDMSGGKRLYHIPAFTAGQRRAEPTNEPLIVGNYYFLTLNYVDTDVSVYGPDTSFATNYYQSGYAFTAPDEATEVTAIGEFSDLMFHIFSAQDIYAYGARYRFDVEPGENAELSMYAEGPNMEIIDVILDLQVGPEVTDTFTFKEAPIFIPIGGKMEWYYDDDYTDALKEIHTHMSFYYKPPNPNG